MIDMKLLKFVLILSFAHVLSACDSTSNVANAGEYKLIKKGAPGSSYQYANDPGGVCETYEKNLRQFASEPFGMACERKLDPSLGFKRPTWKELDPWKHQELMKGLYKIQRWRHPPTIDSNDWEGILKWILGLGLAVEFTKVDLDGDGKTESIIRTGKMRRCIPSKEYKRASPGRLRLLIADNDLTRIEKQLLPRDNIFIFRDEIYTDQFYGLGGTSNDSSKPTAELFLFIVGTTGAGVKCKFHHFQNNS